MKDILEEIVMWKHTEVDGFKSRMPPRRLYAMVEKELQTPCVSMKSSLAQSETGIIAEFKRKSPSKGWIKEECKAEMIVPEYQAKGAAAVSILTDERYFGGSDNFIRAAREAGVVIPVLYKDFVVDEYQLFMARHAGASAVLLIAAVLDEKRCEALTHTAHELGMEVLLEIHREEELEYCRTKPDMCGVNNRNLGTFETDVRQSFLIAEKLPKNMLKVSESGISSPTTVRALRENGFRGFLIGETFMKADNPGAALGEFINSILRDH